MELNGGARGWLRLKRRKGQKRERERKALLMNKFTIKPIKVDLTFDSRRRSWEEKRDGARVEIEMVS